MYKVICFEQRFNAGFGVKEGRLGLGQVRPFPGGAFRVVEPPSDWKSKQTATPVPAPVPRPIRPVGTPELGSAINVIKPSV